MMYIYNSLSVISEYYEDLRDKIALISQQNKIQRVIKSERDNTIFLLIRHHAYIPDE